MDEIRQLDKLATDLSWDMHGFFLELVDKRKSSGSLTDVGSGMLLSFLFKDRLCYRLLILRDTPVGPIKTVDEVLPQMIAEVRAIQEEFEGSNPIFLPFFIMWVKRVRNEMLEIVRTHEQNINRNGRLEPNLHQRAASYFKKMFYYQLVVFINCYKDFELL